MISINNVQYQFTGDTLGKGGFGEVSLYQASNSRKKIAVKCQLSDTEEEQAAISHEFDIHMALSLMDNSENIVEMIGKEVEPMYKYFGMEYASGGILLDKIIVENTAHPKKFKNYSKMLIKGLKFLHDNGVVHRDIKPDGLWSPENLLLTGSGVLKIADFGKACRYIVDDVTYCVDNTIGADGDAVPELLQCKWVEGPPLDIFTSGVTLLQMVTGSLSTWDTVNDAMYRRWESGQSIATDVWNGVEPGIMIVLRMMTSVEKRATIEEIENSGWFMDGRQNLREKPQKKDVFNFGLGTAATKKRKRTSTTSQDKIKKAKN